MVADGLQLERFEFVEEELHFVDDKGVRPVVPSPKKKSKKNGWMERNLKMFKADQWNGRQLAEEVLRLDNGSRFDERCQDEVTLITKPKRREPKNKKK